VGNHQLARPLPILGVVPIPSPNPSVSVRRQPRTQSLAVPLKREKKEEKIPRPHPPIPSESIRPINRTQKRNKKQRKIKKQVASPHLPFPCTKNLDNPIPYHPDMTPRNAIAMRPCRIYNNRSPPRLSPLCFTQTFRHYYRNKSTNYSNPLSSALKKKTRAGH